MLMRLKKKYQVPLLETVQQSLQALENIQADDEDTNIDSAIHRVFLTIWTTFWAPSEDNVMPCVTQRCLAVCSLHADGSCGSPKGISPEISRLEYVMHLTFLHQIHTLAATKYGGNIDQARLDM